MGQPACLLQRARRRLLEKSISYQNQNCWLKTVFGNTGRSALQFHSRRVELSREWQFQWRFWNTVSKQRRIAFAMQSIWPMFNWSGYVPICCHINLFELTCAFCMSNSVFLQGWNFTFLFIYVLKSYLHDHIWNLGKKWSKNLPRN